MTDLQRVTVVLQLPVSPELRRSALDALTLGAVVSGATITALGEGDALALIRLIETSDSELLEDARASLLPAATEF